MQDPFLSLERGCFNYRRIKPLKGLNHVQKIIRRRTVKQHDKTTLYGRISADTFYQAETGSALRVGQQTSLPSAGSVGISRDNSSEPAASTAPLINTNAGDINHNTP